MLEQELIFLGKPRFPLGITRFRPTARLLRYEALPRQRSLQYQSSGPGIRSWVTVCPQQAQVKATARRVTTRSLAKTSDTLTTTRIG